MKRIVLWCLSTVSVVALLFGYHTSTSGMMATSPPTSIISGSTPGSSSPLPSTGSAGSGSAGTGSSKSSQSSTVLGSVASTQWGPVQVELTMNGNTIIKVAIPQYPNGNPRDDEINSYALPILIQETLDAQSAAIDMVSGATVTSTGYLQSLQSALDRASS